MAKILIVDDMASMRKMVAFTLESSGHEVVQADDGDVALDIAKSQTGFSLVITDVNMPNMDGFELIKTVRQNAEYEDVPIIILSSLAGSEEIEKGMSIGANSYMVKPFDPKRIQYEVAKYLN